MSQILIVDDDAALRATLGEALRAAGHQARGAGNGPEALRLLQQEPAELVILDMVLPGIDGLELLQELTRRRPGLEVIMVTGHASIGSAIAAMKMGAFDYVVKPFRMEELEMVVSKALERGRLRSENQRLRQELAVRSSPGAIIGKSPAIQRILDLVERIAPTRSTVLITGASGTGKELIARFIHAGSDRRNGPFVGVNCGALPDPLLEDELFGHMRGAFTDAVSDRVGRFEQAEGGTLFLDEISSMSPSLQVKLLRVLQEREVTPLGSTQKVRVDVRIVAATNTDIRQAVERKEFREDLYYRLNVIHIALPTLQERTEDIPLLVRHFLDKYCRDLSVPTKHFSREAMKYLCACPWPGNVRQLENLIERCVALSGDTGELGAQDLPEEIRESREAPPVPPPAPDGMLDLDRLVRDFEERMIYRALEDSGWVKTHAASRLNIKRTTLIEKMKRLGIPLRSRPQPEQA